MKGLDAVKAVALAVLILALNFALTYLAVFVYATLVAPGRPQAFYSAAAPGIAGWTAPVGGAVLFLAAIHLLSRRQPRRNAFKFAGMAWLAYAIVDIGSGAASGGAAMMSPAMAVSMGLALAGALAGAALAQARSRSPAPSGA